MEILSAKTNIHISILGVHACYSIAQERRDSEVQRLQELRASLRNILEAGVVNCSSESDARHVKPSISTAPSRACMRELHAHSLA